MFLYDADPQDGSARSCPLVKFEGSKVADCDETVFQSFKKAKLFSKTRILQRMAELEHELKKLEETTVENCPVIKSPF